MRDDAVLGRALPLDRGLGPLPMMRMCSVKLVDELSVETVHCTVSTAVVIAIYN